MPMLDYTQTRGVMFCTNPFSLVVRYTTYKRLREKIAQRNSEEIERAATVKSLHDLKGNSTNLKMLFVRFKLGNKRIR